MADKPMPPPPGRLPPWPNSNACGQHGQFRKPEPPPCAGGCGSSVWAYCRPSKRSCAWSRNTKPATRAGFEASCRFWPPGSKTDAGKTPPLPSRSFPDRTKSLRLSHQPRPGSIQRQLDSKEEEARQPPWAPPVRRSL